jgi:hypothetical protein
MHRDQVTLVLQVLLFVLLLLFSGFVVFQYVGHLRTAVG